MGTITNTAFNTPSLISGFLVVAEDRTSFSLQHQAGMKVTNEVVNGETTMTTGQLLLQRKADDANLVSNSPNHIFAQLQIMRF